MRDPAGRNAVQRHEAPPFEAVLLIAFGGPTSRDEIRPFLENVTRGRPIPPARLDEVVRHYEAIGGRSPLNELTLRQAAALQEALARQGPAVPVYVGMRNWHPTIAETLREMERAGVRRAVGVILAAHDSEASSRRYRSDVAGARSDIERTGGSPPQIHFAPNWHAEDGFIRAVAARIESALAAVPEATRSATPVVFTAHSLPVEMAARSPYVEQLTRSSALVADLLGQRRWQIAYQSRSGRPDDPWLEPDVNRVIEDLARDGERTVVVAPIGFVCDHVEVLYDLDVEARATAQQHGVSLIRAGTVNDHPAFIAMLADLVRRAWPGR